MRILVAQEISKQVCKTGERGPLPTDRQVLLNTTQIMKPNRFPASSLTTGWWSNSSGIWFAGYREAKSGEVLRIDRWGNITFRRQSVEVRAPGQL
jgi:hypothetical protein